MCSEGKKSPPQKARKKEKMGCPPDLAATREMESKLGAMGLKKPTEGTCRCKFGRALLNVAFSSTTSVTIESIGWLEKMAMSWIEVVSHSKHRGRGGCIALTTAFKGWRGAHLLI